MSGFQSDAIQDGLEEMAPGPLVNYIQEYMNLDLIGARYEGKPPLTAWHALQYPTEVKEHLVQTSYIVLFYTPIHRLVRVS